ncbi:MAG: nucleoside-diphosphate kinase [Candidatus Nanoarchaeia archaeon]|jgi:nucleoside-diphosphate kinase
MTEKTVVLIKPDGIARSLVGELISRFEKVGLKIVAMKMIWVEKDIIGKHYSDNESYLKGVGVKTLENYEKYGFDANESLGTKDPLKIGKKVRDMNMEFMSSGPVIAMILEAPGAISIVRKIVGSTFPDSANPGTIRGDYSYDSAMDSNIKKRTTRNLVHASGNKEDAEFEIKLWFKESEIYSYKTLAETFFE